MAAQHQPRALVAGETESACTYQDSSRLHFTFLPRHREVLSHAREDCASEDVRENHSSRMKYRVRTGRANAAPYFLLYRPKVNRFTVSMASAVSLHQGCRPEGEHTREIEMVAAPSSSPLFPLERAARATGPRCSHTGPNPPACRLPRACPSGGCQAMRARPSMAVPFFHCLTPVLCVRRRNCRCL